MSRKSYLKRALTEPEVAERVAFVKARPEMDEEALAREMKELGLYSHTSYTRDVAHWVRMIRAELKFAEQNENKT